MKFAKILKNIFFALTIIAVISMATSKRSRRSKARVEAEDAKVVKYVAQMEIKEGSNVNKHIITINQENFNQMNYGIKFTLNEGTLANNAFFKIDGLSYLFDFVHAHNFNCVDQASFTSTVMHFSVYDNSKNYEVIFTFPNGWAFGTDVSILALCNKFYDRWNNFKSKREGLKSEIMKLYSHITLLEQQQQENANTVAALQTKNTQLTTQAQQLNATIVTQKATIETISKAIDQLGTQESTESTKLNGIESKITQEQAKAKQQQTFIDNANSNMAAIQTISQSSIDNEWAQFAVYLNNMINIQSTDDAIRSQLEGWKSNAQSNANTIMTNLYSWYN